MKILVVDDKKENLYLMERMIIKLGYEFVSAENGKQALEKLYNDDFYMIISDILMPVMDGFQFCQAVRSDKKFINVLGIRSRVIPAGGSVCLHPSSGLT